METVLIVAVLALLVIAAATGFARRLGVAAPLLLVLLGIGTSLVPVVPAFEIEPEWILAGVLPPLLYSASVSMPSLDFRREFTAIGGLSVALVVVSSLILGVFFWWVIPGISLAWGVALGAVVSPTDAVATSIVKGLGVSPRIVTMLEGESLLNDATALVMLRTAIAGAAASVSFWGVLGDFVYAILVASAIGAVVGVLNLLVRERVSDATVSTVISFTIPFIASIPAELLGASGLVAAVVAGLVTGRGALKRLKPWHRLAEQQNWRTIELLLESTVFLLLGLQLTGIVGDVVTDHDGVLPAILIALGGLVLTIAVRSGYVTLLVSSLQRRARRHEKLRPRMQVIKERIDKRDAFFAAEPREIRPVEIWPDEIRDAVEGHERHSGPVRSGPDRPAGAPRPPRAADPAGRRSPWQRDAAGGARAFPARQPKPPMTARARQRVERFRLRVTRLAADLDYFLERPIGWREGTVVVWAGMRGAVTLAAAQTFPADTPHRSTLILIAFIVAAVSLLLQGGTLKWLIGRVKPRPEPAGAARAEREQLSVVLNDAAAAERATAEADGRTADQVSIITAQREALLRVRDEGTCSSETLAGALDVLDAEQISVELRGGE